jgi:hypothetical protein
MSGIRAWLFLAAATAMPGVALAQHDCDASISEPGWKMIASRETVDVKDGAPYQNGGDWFVDRTVTELPLCNYINTAGNYSLRSYSLSPETRTERAAICKGPTPVAPYKGACPPK